MAKNLMGKTRPENDPYMIFEGGPFGPTKVLKSWQIDHAKPFARWFVSVGPDLGDAYVAEILGTQVLTYIDPKTFYGQENPDDAMDAFVQELKEAKSHLPKNRW